MAAAAMLKNRKIAISQQRFEHNLEPWQTFGLSLDPMAPFGIFMSWHAVKKESKKDNCVSVNFCLSVDNVKYPWSQLKLWTQSWTMTGNECRELQIKTSQCTELRYLSFNHVLAILMWNVYCQLCTQTLSYKLGRHRSVYILCDNE